MDALATVATILAFAYFLPSLIAISRWYNFGSVFAVNLFFGWTLVGWVVALSMSMTPKAKTSVTVINQQPTAQIDENRRACPSCAEMILPQAKLCRFCGQATGFVS